MLAAVENREAYANLLLPKLLAERAITGRDAALATELAYGTLRGLGTYDAVLAACSDRPLDKLDPPVLQVLRLGAHQLLATRVGDHAAVATSVDLAKAVAGPRVSGYVNAVLRRVSTRDLDAWLAIVAPDPATDPDGYLAVRYSYPRWISRRLPRRPRPTAADVRDSRPHWPPATSAPASRWPPSPAARTATRSCRQAPNPAAGPRSASPSGGDPSALIARVAAVQDEASQLAAHSAGQRPGRPPTVAEAPRRRPNAGWTCARDRAARPACFTAWPRTAGARLVAAELHPHRAALVGRWPAPQVRLRPSAAAVLVADGPRPPWRDGGFDRVLVDVPCSGLGALRRRPEARWRKSESDLPALAELQRTLLRSALSACRPGAWSRYVTCSPFPAETRDVVTAVTGSMPDVEILDAPAILGRARPRSPARCFAQLWTHRHGTDAIFIALLRRTAR